MVVSSTNVLSFQVVSGFPQWFGYTCHGRGWIGWVSIRSIQQRILWDQSFKSLWKMHHHYLSFQCLLSHHSHARSSEPENGWVLLKVGPRPKAHFTARGPAARFTVHIISRTIVSWITPRFLIGSHPLPVMTLKRRYRWSEPRIL